MEHWHARGHQILVIDNFATGKRELVPRISRLQVVEGSIADREMVRRAFDRFRPTLVVHSAASYKDPSDWREDAATNVLGTVHVIEAARDYGVERFLNFQTVLCYGRPEQSPIPLDHPLRPFTSYGISKVAGEQYLAASDLKWVSLRLANVTGPRLPLGLFRPSTSGLRPTVMLLHWTPYAISSICRISSPQSSASSRPRR